MGNNENEIATTLVVNQITPVFMRGVNDGVSSFNLLGVDQTAIQKIKNLSK
jgi:hypothetical protein